jgi:acetylornithine/N-succinyldiaminopimelate aminotransferase
MSDHLLKNITRYPVTLERGEGVRVWDTDGVAYLDMLGGIAVSALGHNHPALVTAIQEQASRLLHVSNLFSTPQLLDAAERVVRVVGDGSVYFCNSGTEANEAAIKLVRKHAWRSGQAQRNEIVALDGSFHGRTYGALAATMQPGKWEGFDPMPQGFVCVPFNDVDALDAAVTDRTAAVMLEPIQGESGVRPLTPEFAAAAQRLCRERGALLLCDEIQTGVGRTGRWWGYEHYDLAPDVVSLGKGLGGGFPVAAMWASEPVAGALRPSDHGTTIGGAPLGTAAVCAVLDTVERDGLVWQAEKVGAVLAEAMRPLGTEVRGAGLLLAVELPSPIATKVVVAGLQRGLICNAVTATAIRFAPPLVITEAEALEGAELLARSIEAVA